MSTRDHSVDPDAFRAFERAAHDEIADGYCDFFTAITNYAVDPLLEEASVFAGCRMLDVATGPGNVAARASHRGATVIGVDIAPRMLALAAQHVPGVEFRVADAENLPFRDAEFEAVVTNFGIGHFPRPERAVAEFARVLMHHGMVALSWWDVPARHRVNGIFFDAMTEVGVVMPADLPAAPPMFRFSDDRELSALLQSAALRDVKVGAFTFSHRLASADDLWAGILGGTVRTSIGIRRQSRDVQEHVRAVFTRLVGVYANEHGVDVPVAFKIVSGRK